MDLTLLILSWPHHAFNPRKKPEDSTVEVETIFGTASYGALGCESKQLVHAVRLSKDHLERTPRIPLEQMITTLITRICNLLCNYFLLLLNHRSIKNFKYHWKKVFRNLFKLGFSFDWLLLLLFCLWHYRLLLSTLGVCARS